MSSHVPDSSLEVPSFLDPEDLPEAVRVLRGLQGLAWDVRA